MNPVPAGLIYEIAKVTARFDVNQFYLDYHTRWVDEIGVDAIMQTSSDFQDGRHIRTVMALEHYANIIKALKLALNEIYYSKLF